MKALREHVRHVPDFPVHGVIFRDISPLLEKKFKETIDAMCGLFTQNEIKNIDLFAGVDARGFIFASGLANQLNKNFKMIRKMGKMPPPCSEISYNTEYSSAGLQVSDGQGRVIIVDDVLATGGTMTAAADLCTRAGYEVVGMAALIDLPFIHDHSYNWRGLHVRSLISYSSPKDV